MTKHVITTVQTIVRKYYVDVKDPEWARDSIVMNELDQFSSEFLSEDILDTQTVEDWPKARNRDSVNGATMTYDYNTEQWVTNARWDLA